MCQAGETIGDYRLEKIASEQQLAAQSLLSLNDLKMQEEQLQRDVRVSGQYLETYVKNSHHGT